MKYDRILSMHKLPEGYQSLLTVKQTQVGIKRVKDYFEDQMAMMLNLVRVSAPLFVTQQSGLNDRLNNIEKPVFFQVSEGNLEIVQSLAKWKRHALYRYGFDNNQGLYTDMSAIRQSEQTSNIHSYFVDQWDWEKIIDKHHRNEAYLVETVERIYSALLNTEKMVNEFFDFKERLLPDQLFFISSQELCDLYPNLSPKDREYAITKEKGAVFISQIGLRLRDGSQHDTRAYDYDDWTLNGDILVYYPILDIALELSSMGIRVDKQALIRQSSGYDLSSPYHQGILNETLPLTIGGGIGQSRLCLFFLRKAHIGEVQSSVWPKDFVDYCHQQGVYLL